MLESEGIRQASINIADGKKNSVILESEAALMDQVNRAHGEAEAIFTRAEATARGIHKLSNAIRTEGGAEAASLRIAEQYITVFGHLARESTTMLLPSDTNNPASMMAQALSIYKGIVGVDGHRPRMFPDPHSPFAVGKAIDRGDQKEETSKPPKVKDQPMKASSDSSKNIRADNFTLQAPL